MPDGLSRTCNPNSAVKAVIEGCRGTLSIVRLGGELNRWSRWRNARAEVGWVGRKSGEEQREENGETSGEEGEVSFDAQEDGLVVEERKEKFSSNIVAGRISEYDWAKDFVAGRTMTEDVRENYLIRVRVRKISGCSEGVASGVFGL